MQGLTLEDWFRQVAAKEAASMQFTKKTNFKEWERKFDEWIGSHDPNKPVLSDEAMASREARAWFISFLIDVLIANPKLTDNLALFHATHKNLAAAGSVPSETSIGAAKTAIRLQTDLSGNPIDAQPKFILIPAALESTVDQLMPTLDPASPADAMVAARSLTPIVGPRLDLKGQTAACYLFADPSFAPVLEYAELEGYEGPQIETRLGWNVLGGEVRVVWHLGAGAINRIVRRPILLILALKALQTGPGFDQRSVHGEMLPCHEWLVADGPLSPALREKGNWTCQPAGGLLRALLIDA